MGWLVAMISFSATLVVAEKAKVKSPAGCKSGAIFNCRKPVDWSAGMTTGSAARPAGGLDNCNVTAAASIPLRWMSTRIGSVDPGSKRGIGGAETSNGSNQVNGISKFSIRPRWVCPYRESLRLSLGVTLGFGASVPSDRERVSFKVSLSSAG